MCVRCFRYKKDANRWHVSATLSDLYSMKMKFWTLAALRGCWLLANTDILPYKIKYRGFSLPDLVRAGLWLSLAVMFCGCTSNLAGLATVGKTAQQAAENTSEQQSARENSSTTAVPAEQGVNQAANVPVPPRHLWPVNKQPFQDRLMQLMTTKHKRK